MAQALPSLRCLFCASEESPFREELTIWRSCTKRERKILPLEREESAHACALNGMLEGAVGGALEVRTGSRGLMTPRTSWGLPMQSRSLQASICVDTLWATSTYKKSRSGSPVQTFLMWAIGLSAVAGSLAPSLPQNPAMSIETN